VFDGQAQHRQAQRCHHHHADQDEEDCHRIGQAIAGTLDGVE
jgi:hypothetical protein